MALRNKGRPLGVYIVRGYRKIPKISPGAYLFQRPFFERWSPSQPFFGCHPTCFKINWASLVVASKFTVFLCFTLYLRAISKYKPLRGAYIWRGDLTEGFLRYEFGELIFGGAYSWRAYIRNFTVFALSICIFGNLTFVRKYQWIHIFFFSKLNTESWADRKLLTALFQGRWLSHSSL